MTLGRLTYLLSSGTTHMMTAESKRICVFALNRHLTGEMELFLALELRGAPGPLSLAESRVLAGFDFAATNSAAAETVRPSPHADAKVNGAGIDGSVGPAASLERLRAELCLRLAGREEGQQFAVKRRVDHVGEDVGGHHDAGEEGDGRSTSVLSL